MHDQEISSRHGDASDLLATQLVDNVLERPTDPPSSWASAMGVDNRAFVAVCEKVRKSSWAQARFRDHFPHYGGVARELCTDRSKLMAILNGKAVHPHILELHLGLSCQADCQFCYRKNQPYIDQKHMKEMDEATVVGLVRECLENGTRRLILSGGLEPTLSRHFLPVLRTGIDGGADVRLYTNGIRLSSVEFREALMPAEQVRVSLHAFTRTTYEKVLRIDAFDRVVANLAALVKLRDDTGSPVRIGLDFVLVPDNLDDLVGCLSLAESLGLDFTDVRVPYGGTVEECEYLSSQALIDHLHEVATGWVSDDNSKLRVTLPDGLRHGNPAFDLGRVPDHNHMALLPGFRTTLDPFGRAYGVCIAAQTQFEDSRYQIGAVKDSSDLSTILAARSQWPSLPYDQKRLTPWDHSLLHLFEQFYDAASLGMSPWELPFIEAT